MFHQDSLENATATTKYKSWNWSDVYFVFMLHAQHRSVGRLVHHDWDLITNKDISVCSSTFTTGRAEKKVDCTWALGVSSWKWHTSPLSCFAGRLLDHRLTVWPTHVPGREKNQEYSGAARMTATRRKSTTNAQWSASISTAMWWKEQDSVEFGKWLSCTSVIFIESWVAVTRVTQR